MHYQPWPWDITKYFVPMIVLALSPYPSIRINKTDQGVYSRSPTNPTSVNINQKTKSSMKIHSHNPSLNLVEYYLVDAYVLPM